MEMDTNSNDNGSPYSEVEDVGNTEEISVKSSDEVEIDWDTLIANTNITTRPISCKPRRTFEEYVSTQKVYDVLKDPEDGKPFKTTLSLKTIDMNSKKRKTHNAFIPFVNITLNEQHATHFMDGRSSKTMKTVKGSNDDVLGAAPTTASIDDTTTTTNTTILTTPAATTNSTVWEKSVGTTTNIITSTPPSTTTKPIELPLHSDIKAESQKATTTTTNTAISTPVLNQKPQRANLSTSNKKSIMRPVRIPLSIASKAHKTLTLKAQKIPIHSLINSRNCVLLSTTSSETDGNKGILKFVPSNSRPEKYTADKCNDLNTTDSNSGEAFSCKEQDEVTTIDKPTVDNEVLVATSDNNTEKTPVNIPIVPLMGKRKYTDPSTMPILSFSYRKSLADYIRNAKEFHKRAKMCSTEPTATTDNSNSNEENMVSNDIDSADSKDGTSNNDDTNMECDDESNVAQCKSNENPQSIVTAMHVEQTTNSVSDISENVTTTKATQCIENPLDSNGNKNNLEEMKSGADTKNTKGAESTTNADNLTNLETAVNTETMKDMESNESTDNIKVVESTEVTKKTMHKNSAEGTHNQNDAALNKGIKTINDIESAVRSDNLKDKKSSEGTKNLKNIELTEGTNDLNDVETAKDTKTLGDIESAESTDNLKYKKSANCTKNPIDIDLSKGTPNESGKATKKLNYIVSTERADNLEDVESPAGTKTLEDIVSADHTKNITTTLDMDSQIDIESDLCTYEIFNNVSGISNANRNQLTQTKDSTIKILKNIWELKEKVQQQAEEIMSLKAAMKFLNTTNVLNKS